MCSKFRLYDALKRNTISMFIFHICTEYQIMWTSKIIFNNGHDMNNMNMCNIVTHTHTFILCILSRKLVGTGNAKWV